MMGLGATCIIKPLFGTRVYFEINMNISQTIINTPNVLLKFGTGTAPINGASSTGTSIGTTKSATLSTAGGVENLIVSGMATGLTPGTTYWCDVALAGNLTGTASISNVDFTAFEL
jgi:hypothetical protein